MKFIFYKFIYIYDFSRFLKAKNKKVGFIWCEMRAVLTQQCSHLAAPTGSDTDPRGAYVARRAKWAKQVGDRIYIYIYIHTSTYIFVHINICA